MSCIIDLDLRCVIPKLMTPSLMYHLNCAARAAQSKRETLESFVDNNRGSRNNGANYGWTAIAATSCAASDRDIHKGVYNDIVISYKPRVAILPLIFPTAVSIDHNFGHIACHIWKLYEGLHIESLKFSILRYDVTRHLDAFWIFISADEKQIT